MAKSKRAAAQARTVTGEEKVANLLALLLVKGAPPGEAIVTLTRVGFTPPEVCSLLDTTPGNVAQTNYLARNKPRKPAARKK